MSFGVVRRAGAGGTLSNLSSYANGGHHLLLLRRAATSSLNLSPQLDAGPAGDESGPSALLTIRLTLPREFQSAVGFNAFSKVNGQNEVVLTKTFLKVWEDLDYETFDDRVRSLVAEAGVVGGADSLLQSYPYYHVFPRSRCFEKEKLCDFDNLYTSETFHLFDSDGEESGGGVSSAKEVEVRLSKKYFPEKVELSSLDTMTMLSFYTFPREGLERPDLFAEKLKKLWKKLHVKGRIYVAEEGVNAQVSVSTKMLKPFLHSVSVMPELSEISDPGINIDPIPLSMSDFSKLTVFKSLHVRVRPQVLTDGLESEEKLDLQDFGTSLHPKHWHDKVMSSAESEEKTILLDCRNKYETEVGKFVGSEPLNTTVFSETWGALKSRLKDVDKDAEILTYCTGGIRCVKVGAWLKQEMGFNNVNSLQGGIVAYDRYLNSARRQSPEEAECNGGGIGVLKSKEKETTSLFHGTNYVFDNRVVRSITDHKLGTCITCSGPASKACNCLNTACHKRMVQCDECARSFHGCCGEACRNRFVNSKSAKSSIVATISSGGANSQLSLSAKNVKTPRGHTDCREYAEEYSSKPQTVFEAIEHNTKIRFPEGSHMCTAGSQGRLLSSLAGLATGGKGGGVRVLEIGTFTGYATCCFAEGSGESGYVLSLERDQRAVDLALHHVRSVRDGGGFGEASSRLAIDPFRNLVADSDKGQDFKSVALRAAAAHDEEDRGGLVRLGDACHKATVCIKKVDDALAYIEQLSTTRAEEPFDIIFIDADKARLLEYVDACISSDALLRQGGVVLVDNTLWKGGVVDSSSLEDPSKSEKMNRRKRKLAATMHRFNDAVRQDDRVEVVMLPMRDGLSVIRKKLN